MKTLPVHVKGRLATLPWFFSEEWSAGRYLKGGTCLPTHIIRIAEALSGKPPDRAWKTLGKHTSYYGVTLQQLFDAVRKRMDTELVALKCDHVYDALDLLMRGIPSVLIVDSRAGCPVCNRETGVVPWGYIEQETLEENKHRRYHSFAVVGWDGGAGYNHLIVQENRSDYGVNGYYKLPVGALMQNKQFGRFIGIAAH